MDSGRLTKQPVIEGLHYRFTILTPRLLRMEYSEENEFIDSPTQVVVNRCFPETQYRIKETEEELQIITEALRLKYDKRSFSSEGLQITMSGQFFAYTEKWNYGDEPKDLKGTARTLDGADGSIPLEHGILSHKGWSLLDDSQSFLLDENGWIAQRKDSKAKDIYFFGYGRDYLACLKDFYGLTGKVPLLPRFALGNWWSRYYEYSEQTYLDLMDRFELEKIPFTVSVIDMDWHLTQIDPKYGTGWTGYTWNRELFPEPEKFLEKLHNRGMKVTLNVHPADGVRAFEECYAAFAEYMGVDIINGDAIEFEPEDSKFMEGYFQYVHLPLEKQGVDFWWIDWQQGTNSGVKGLDPLWMLNHYHYLNSQKENNRGLIFSRYAGPGSHRYPVGFSGDTVVSWESLDFQPYFTANASNIGYGWWSHDIGGHMFGGKDDELAVRWLQFGVFSPIMRLHSSKNEFNGKEPWRYNMIAEKVMKYFLRLRHRLIPYLYAMNLRAQQECIPLLQPLYYHYPNQYVAYRMKNEYYFGSELLVCPITKPANRQSHMAKVQGWLPEGIWTDYFTGMIYEGNRNVEFYRGIGEIPVLMKAGGILPLDGRYEGNGIDNPSILEININAVHDGKFSLWEDEGTKADFCREEWAETIFSFCHGEVSSFTIEPPCGNTTILPPKRTYVLRFYGQEEGVTSRIYVGGDEKDGVVSSYDCKKGVLTIRVSDVDICERVDVQLMNAGLYDNRKKEKIFDYLNQAEISFEMKSRIYRIVSQMDQGTDIVYVMSQMNLLEVSEDIKGPVIEVLASKV